MTELELKLEKYYRDNLPDNPGHDLELLKVEDLPYSPAKGTGEVFVDCKCKRCGYLMTYIHSAGKNSFYFKYFNKWIDYDNIAQVTYSKDDVTAKSCDEVIMEKAMK